jgi:hypothetical protein
MILKKEASVTDEDIQADDTVVQIKAENAYIAAFYKW